MTKSKKIPYVKNVELSPIAHSYTGELGAAIDALNNRFSFVYIGRSYGVYDHEKQMLRDMDALRSHESESILYEGKIVNPAQLWAARKSIRRTFEDVIFKPYVDKDPAIQEKYTDFNLWKGWNVPYVDTMIPEEFDAYVQPWLDHIHHIFCSGKQEQSDYFIHWLAHLVQKPDDKPGVAIVLQSGQGFGKGLFMTLLEEIVGRRYVSRITDAHQVAGGFSGQMKDKMLINFDEATWGGDKKSNGRLKALVTEIHLSIEAKHQDAEDIDHYARFFITSNSAYPVPIEHDDRRFFVPDVTTQKPSEQYFLNLIDLLKNEYAIACFFTYLQDVNLKGINIRKFPNSVTRQKIKAESLVHNDVYKAFLLAAYNEDVGTVEIMSKGLKASYLYEFFCEWKAKTTFKNTTVSSTAFGKAMSDANLKRRKSDGYNVYDITHIDIEKYLKSIGVI